MVEAFSAVLERLDLAGMADFWQERADREGVLADAYEVLRMTLPAGALSTACLDAASYRRGLRETYLGMAKGEAGEVSR